MNIKYKIRYALGKIKKRIIEFFRYKFILEIYKNSINNSLERILALKGKYANEDCFIIGNGPSLREMDLSKLKGKYCIFFNGAFDLRKYTTSDKCIHVCEDRLVFEDHKDALNSLDGLNFYPSDLSHMVDSKNPIICEFHRGYPESKSDWPPFVDLKSDAPIFYWGGTVAYFGIQIAKWMGFKNIYIIGVDLAYSVPKSVVQAGAVLTSTEDDPNHYKSSYFGKGLRWHVPMPERMLKAFSRTADNKDMINIYNAGVGGNLNCFSRVDFNDID